MALGQAIGRVGCFMAGCCYGMPTALPWGVTFRASEIAPLGVALHPTQLYEMLFNFTIFALLFLRRNRVTFRGEQILSYLFLYGATRSIVEVFRGDPRGFWLWNTVSTSQLIGAAMMAAGIILYFRIREKNRISPKDAAPADKRGPGAKDAGKNSPGGPARAGKKPLKGDRS